MINIDNAKFGDFRHESPPPTLPKPTIDERKKIIDNMRKENLKRFTNLKPMLSSQLDGELLLETGPTLSV